MAIKEIINKKVINSSNNRMKLLFKKMIKNLMDNAFMSFLV